MAQVLAFADRFILTGLLVRSWGPDLYADWVLLLATAGLLAMGELGLGIYFGNCWQHAHATGDQARFARLVRVSIYCYGAIAVILVGMVAGFIFTDGPFRLLSLRHIPGEDARLVVLFLAAAVISGIMRGSISQIYRGQGQFARGTIVSLFSIALYLVFAVLVVPLGASPVLLAALFLMCDFAGTGLMVFDLRRRFPEIVLRPSRPDGRELADIVAHTKWNVVLMNAPIALLQAPVLILGFAGVGGSALTSFVLLRTMTNYLRSTTTLVSIATGVEIAPILHSGGGEHLKTLLDTAGRIISGFVGGLCAGALLLGQDFVRLWSGRSDLFDPIILYWLIFGAAVAAASGPLFSLLMLGNRPRSAAVASVLQLVLVLAGCAVLTPTYGVTGAAAALAIGEVVASLLIIPMAARDHFGIDPWRYLLGCALMFLASAIWCSAVLALAIRYLGSSTPIQFAVCGAVFGLLGLFPAMIGSLTPSQRSAVQRLVTNLVRRFLTSAPVS